MVVYIKIVRKIERDNSMNKTSKLLGLICGLSIGCSSVAVDLGQALQWGANVFAGVIGAEAGKDVYGYCKKKIDIDSTHIDKAVIIAIGIVIAYAIYSASNSDSKKKK